jgi:hypothetical protein
MAITIITLKERNKQKNQEIIIKDLTIVIKVFDGAFVALPLESKKQKLEPRQ